MCACVVYKPTQILAWELPLGVLVLHSESNTREDSGGGERGRRREEQQMLPRGLDSVVVSLETGLEEERKKAQG